MKKTAKIIAAMLIVVCFIFALTACNKDRNKPSAVTDLTAIYQNTYSVGEFTGVKAEMILPSGWSVFTAISANYNKNSDSGYLKEMNSFVVTNGTYMSVMRCGDTELLFPESTAIVAVKVYFGLYVIQSADGGVSVYDKNGRLKIARANVQGTVTTGSGGTLTKTDLTKVVNVLSKELIAVSPTYDVNKSADSSYTSIYRVSTGKVACRVKNVGATLTKIDGFDNDYVVVTGTVEDSKDTSRIFKIRAGVPSAVENMSGTEYGTVSDNGETEYYSEITYMGDGRFFIHEDWQVKAEEDYTYLYEGIYMKVSRHIYDADADSISVYNSDKYFLNLANNYYDSTRNGISTSSFLQSGYFYATYCITVDSDKNGYYDQFILDGNLNVVLSLSGNFGITSKSVTEVSEVAFYDLALIFTDGYGVVSVLPSMLRIYDKSGKILAENDTYTITTAGLNNGMIIATALDTDGDTVYGGFNVKGEIVIPFNYTKIDPFMGYYTIAERKDGANTVRVLLSLDGVEITQMSDYSVALGDITKNSTGTPIYKVGCYMFTVTDSENKTTYGIKNLNADVSKNVVLPATMVTGSTLYAPTNSPTDVFVFAKFSDTDTFTIYRLV